MAGLRVLAYAKLNLSLRIVGRRPDGYHLLESLMCAVDLADELFLEEAEASELVAEGWAGPPGENLALRAARLLARELAVRKGVRVHLVKRIPAGAGLGGGSSDAASVLAGLNELWGLGLSERELKELGAKLGADVPFFLGESPAWAAGVGEVLRPARDEKIPGAFLIAVPPFPCPTPEVYRLYDELGAAGDSGPFPNDLWPAAVRLRPELSGLRRLLSELAELGSGLTGSGSALFAAFSSPRAARAAAGELAGKTSARLFVARPVRRGYKFLR